MDAPAPDTGPAPAKPTRWVIWLGLLIVLVVYAIVSRPRSGPPLEWGTDLKAAIAQAGQSNRPILVDFYATWCGPCQTMKETVLSKPEFAQATQNWITVQIDVDQQPQLADQYRIETVPTFLVLSPDGRELARQSGTMGIREFVGWMASAQSYTQRD